MRDQKITLFILNLMHIVFSKLFDFYYSYELKTLVQIDYFVATQKKKAFFMVKIGMKKNSFVRVKRCCV